MHAVSEKLTNLRSGVLNLVLGSAALTMVGATIVHAAPAEITFNPGAASLNGGAFTADKLNLLTFARTDLGPPVGNLTSFSQTGILQVNNASLANNTFNIPGLRSTYDLFFRISATGTQSAPSFAGGTAGGTYSSVTASLVGVNGPATFGVTGLSGGNPTDASQPFVSFSGGETVLATGSLIEGTTSFSTSSTGAVLGAAANLTTTFENIFNNFITNPANVTLTLAGAFNNNALIIGVVNGGQSFVLNGGGGDISFNATANPTPPPTPVPEPASMLLVGAGLAGIGFVRRRRQLA